MDATQAVRVSPVRAAKRRRRLNGKDVRLRCDCGLWAVAVVSTYVLTRDEYYVPVSLPVCRHCLTLEMALPDLQRSVDFIHV